MSAGKVREIGCSNFSAAQLREAQRRAAGAACFVSVQNQYSLLHRDPEAEVLPECGGAGVAFLPYFPLASGLLTGKYAGGKTAASRERGMPRLGLKVSDSRETYEGGRADRTFAEGQRPYTAGVGLLLAAARKAGVASVIAGATKPEQVRANASAAGWKLTEEELPKSTGSHRAPDERLRRGLSCS